MSIADHLQANAVHERVRTGVKAIDDACRGGVPLGKRVLLGGAPGSGKSTLATQIGVDLARAGVQVLFLATDESVGAIAVRCGQLAGQSRDLLEAGDGAAISKAREALDMIPLTLVDEMSLEAAARMLGSEGPRALIVDSLQTVRCDAHEKIRGAKAKVEKSLEVLAEIAATGVLVICTSELSRQGYGGKRQGDISSAKNSGSIEYAFDAMFAMRVEGKHVHVTTPKNRMGAKPDFDLFLDTVRARFFEEGELPRPEVRPARELAPVAVTKRAPAPSMWSRFLVWMFPDLCRT